MRWLGIHPLHTRGPFSSRITAGMKLFLNLVVCAIKLLCLPLDEETSSSMRRNGGGFFQS